MLYMKFIILLFLVYVRGDDDDDDDVSPAPPLQDSEQLAKSYGYNLEKFEVKSSGYIISVFHMIPKNPNGEPVLLHHGLSASADIWFIKKEGLAMALTDQGNDVWMINARGSVHSRKHESLSPDTDGEFWNFSWEEMGKEDLPIVIDFILDKTKKSQLYYIGHSMGTTIFFVMASSKPEYNEKIKEMIALAPVYYCHKYQFMMTDDSSMYQKGLEMMKKFEEEKKWEAFPRADVQKNDHQMTCENFPEMAIPYCKMGLNMAEKMVGKYIPAGMGFKTLKHYHQAFKSGVIQAFDYGETENMKRYQQSTPPGFDLSKVKAKDAKKLGTEVPNAGIVFQPPSDEFTHADFCLITSKENEESYNQLLTKIKNIVKM